MGDKFETGDRVIDTANDDPDPMRVVIPAVAEAKYVKIKGKPILEYEGNEDYSPKDMVVTVAFENKLDQLMPGWEEHLDTLETHIEEYKEEWKVEVPRFGYLKPRLKKIDEDGNLIETPASSSTETEDAN